MTKKKPITAAVIIIGNEILSGRTQDTNLNYLAKKLDALGIIVSEALVISDDKTGIIDGVNRLRAEYDYVFTTGGIGPTHDDITSAAVAEAFGVNLEENTDAAELLKASYQRQDLNKAQMKMACLPKNARLIDNRLTGAPGFQMENVFVMAGVPDIMRTMFSSIIDRLQNDKPMITVNIETDIGESVFANELAELQQQYTDINIGSYPSFRDNNIRVNLTLRSTDEQRLQKLQKKLIELITRLGGAILQSHPG